MAVSGSKNFSVTRADIIELALSRLGEFDAADTIDPADTDVANRVLNLMVKGLVSKGADLFLRQEVTLFLQPNQKTYALGLSGAAEATTSYVETTLSAAEASGQTTISVTSSAGMSKDDRVGIKMDDDTIHWSTISSVVSSTSILIATATDAAAASGNNVYVYTTKADKPQKLLYAYSRDTSDLDTPVDLIGENAYQNLSNKDSEGPPNQAWYRPGLDDAGTLHVWPVDGGSTVDKLVFISQVLPDDFDTAAHNPEFPIEWGETLYINLAARLAPHYGLDLRERQLLNAEAAIKLEELLDYDVENADVVFAMDGGRWR